MALVVRDFYKSMAKVEKRLDNNDQLLGKSSMQPFTNANSSTRKILFSTQLEHSIALMEPEIPLVCTGYENRFGDESSSILKLKEDFEVVGKVSKFESSPNSNYYLILRRLDSGLLDVIHRVDYKHLTESYGYLYNNEVLDSLDIGYEVTPKEILRKSYAYDEEMNRCDGVNLNVAYISNDKTMEDGIQISESAAKKLASPLINKVSVNINDNDILLNLFGDINTYKSFPDIGEEVPGGILCATRREKLDEALYMQDVSRLRDILPSDVKFLIEGKVVDMDIQCNNADILKERNNNTQAYYYYNNHIRFIQEFMEEVDKARHVGKTKIPMSYDLEKLYVDFEKELAGALYIKEKEYSGTIIDFYVLQENVPSVGDKITNRYGGKGIISQIIPDERMPILDNGRRVEVFFNSSTCVNRLNPGQLFEMSVNFAGSRLLEYISSHKCSLNQAIDMIYNFMKIVAPAEADAFFIMMDSVEVEDAEWYIDNMIEDGYILVSNSPATESLTINDLQNLYEKFPFIQPYQVLSQIKDSNGNYRYVKARRTIVCADIYIYRLKQYAEEKFSVTSLSSTNIKNENTKSKAAKTHKARYSNTPIRFGEMEFLDTLHAGAEVVVDDLNRSAASTIARRETKKLLTDDPFKVNIDVPNDSRSRPAEILATYLKNIGLKIVFEKKKKKLERIMLHKPFIKNPPNKVMIHLDPKYKVTEEEFIRTRERYLNCNKPLLHKIMIHNEDIKDKDIKE